MEEVNELEFARWSPTWKISLPEGMLVLSYWGKARDAAPLPTMHRGASPAMLPAPRVGNHAIGPLKVVRGTL